MSGKISRGFRKVLRVVARPARLGAGRGGLVIQPYRGYGCRDQALLMGRVFKQPQFGSGLRDRTVSRDLSDLVRRILRHGVGDATLIARFDGTQQTITTDRDGYFRVHMRLPRPPPSTSLWHDMELCLSRARDPDVFCKAAFFVPPAEARYVVVSDIDDTVMYTGVANKAKMLWRLFVEKAHSRIAFPGLAALYNALHRGVAGSEYNPMLYVSRAPWSIYEVLTEFFHLHEIPAGPILFLREWGLTVQRPLPRRAVGHKLELIREMLALYRELPFILIGDSGQRDPEVYTRIVRENPGRVRAVYIRNVSRGFGRQRAIEELAAEAGGLGTSLVLAADSFAMAEHAAQHGFISPEALSEVLKERDADESAPDLEPTLQLEQPGSRGLGEGLGEQEGEDVASGRSEQHPGCQHATDRSTIDPRRKARK